MNGRLEPDARVLRGRAQWRNRGVTRPAFAQEPKSGEESVWDYPRPPRIDPDTRLIEVRFGDKVLARTNHGVRVLETASPPTFYLPPAEVQAEWLVPNGGRSLCEWKGVALDFDLDGGPASVAWCYPETFPEFSSLAGWFSFYPGRVECFVSGERVRPQPGGYYGGWITDEIIGPVKGEPGCRDE